MKKNAVCCLALAMLLLWCAMVPAFAAMDWSRTQTVSVEEFDILLPADWESYDFNNDSSCWYNVDSQGNITMLMASADQTTDSLQDPETLLKAFAVYAADSAMHMKADDVETLEASGVKAAYAPYVQDGMDGMQYLIIASHDGRLLKCYVMNAAEKDDVVKIASGISVSTGK